MKLNIYDYKVVTVKADDRSNVSGHEGISSCVIKILQRKFAD